MEYTTIAKQLRLLPLLEGSAFSAGLLNAAADQLEMLEQNQQEFEDALHNCEQVSESLRKKIAELEQQLAAEKERADYAWRNTNTIEKARQEEMAMRDVLVAALVRVQDGRCAMATGIARQALAKVLS